VGVPVKSDEKIIREFLTFVGGPWHLCAIPNANDKPKGIWTKDLDEAVAFAVKWNEKKWNCYWTVNPLMRDPGPKPAESDVLEMRWIHVDIDPRPKEDLADEQKRIELLLDGAEPTPTLVVFSGGGYQAFWRLEKALPINGREELYGEAKLYNKQMVVNYEADPCQNTDRLMRLAGTVNWPNKRKIEKGRSPSLATIVATTDVSYPIARFNKAVAVQDKKLLGTTKAVTVSGNVQRLNDLTPLKGKVKDDAIRTISHGQDPDDPMRHDGDRSRALWWCVCEMVRGEIDDDTIFSIITDPEWGISGHVRDQPNPEGYAIRQIERAHEEAIASELVELNDQYATSYVGEKFRILQEVHQPGDEYSRILYICKTDFNDFMANRWKTDTNAKGDVVMIELSKWWLRHANRRTYAGVVFYPGKETPGYYNLWRGFAYQAKPGDCSAFLDHVRDNICQGNSEWYDYLVGWMANAVQHPDQPGHTAVVLQGKQGVGKGFLANHFGRLFGRHFLPVRDSNHIFGQFNGHLQECVVLFADESFWVGGRKQSSMLKALITEPDIMIEPKNVNAYRSRNCVHLIMASNEDHVVAREDNDRRFFVLEVGDEQMQNSAYFKAIQDKMEAGGYEALLHFLLNYDLSEYDVRKIPQTEAANAQQDWTRGGMNAWWYEKLFEGRLFSDREGWPEFVFKDDLLTDLREYYRVHGERDVPNKVALGRYLARLMPAQGRGYVPGEHLVQVDADRAIMQTNPRAYSLGTLDVCRKLWEDTKGNGRPIEWPTYTALEVEEHESVREPF